MALLPSGWDPWSELSGLHQTMDRLFGNQFGPERDAGDRQLRRMSVYVPVNVTEGDAGYEVQAPLPGFTPAEIDVTFSEGVLTIKAEHKQDQHGTEGQALRREFLLGADSVRQLTLSGEIDPEKIEARVENGLLTVSVPKAARAQARRIPVGGTSTNSQLTGSSEDG